MAYKTIHSKSGKPILVSAEDFELVSSYSWSVASHGYAQAYEKGSGRAKPQYVLMHRLIKQPPAGYTVDHKNRNKLDNRRSNLRLATNSQNLGNSVGYSSKSKYKGVERLPSGSWRARININRKSLHLGVRPTAEEAARLYDTAAIHHYGKFALLNFTVSGGI